MKVYKQEKEDGLYDALSKPGKMTFASVAKASNLPKDDYDKLVEIVKGKSTKKAISSITDFDLFPLNSILVSTGWNLNDAVFDPIELFVARKTPEDKPVNFEHDNSDIIGHMTSSKVLDLDGNEIPDDISVDELPNKFDIHTSAVLYKKWDDEKLQERMNKLLGEINEGKWFVSMECLFPNFDYALLEKDGTQKIVARNKSTSFLTKHLRFYGGSGVFGDSKVGMVLRDFIFSGKGIVETPANPTSIIYEFSSASAKYYTSTEEAGYHSLSGNSKMEKDMEKELEDVKKQLADALEAKKAVEADLVNANSAKETAEKKIAELSDNITKNDEVIKTLETSKKEVDTALESVSKELAEVKTKLVTVERTHLAIEKGLAKEDAQKYVESTLTSTDEQFKISIEITGKGTAKVAEKLPEVETNPPQVDLPTETAKGTVVPPQVNDAPNASKDLAKLIRKQSGKTSEQE